MQPAISPCAARGYAVQHAVAGLFREFQAVNQTAILAVWLKRHNPLYHNHLRHNHTSNLPIWQLTLWPTTYGVLQHRQTGLCYEPTPSAGWCVQFCCIVSLQLPRFDTAPPKVREWTQPVAAKQLAIFRRVRHGVRINGLPASGCRCRPHSPISEATNEST